MQFKYNIKWMEILAEQFFIVFFFFFESALKQLLSQGQGWGTLLLSGGILIL